VRGEGFLVFAAVAGEIRLEVGVGRMATTRLVDPHAVGELGEQLAALGRFIPEPTNVLQCRAGTSDV